MAKFYEVYRCVGVDEDADPPAVLLAYNRAVLVALADGDGFTVKSRHPNVVVVEVTDPAQLIAHVNARHDALTKPGVDPKIREAMTPRIVPSVRGSTRYFSIYGKGLVGPPPTFIEAKSGKSSKDDARLQVVVVEEKEIKLAIRNLRVFDPDSGGLVDHANRPSDFSDDRIDMNAVWLPQANISFSLVSADPLVIDERDPATQKELAEALDLRPGTVAHISEIIDPRKLANVIANRNKTSADFTIVVARKAVDSAKSVVNGTTIPSGRFAVVTDLRDVTTMAHEAGHFIGGHDSKGGWVDEPDNWSKGNARLLMRGGGAGWKIGFDFAMRCRRFPTH